MNWIYRTLLVLGGLIVYLVLIQVTIKLVLESVLDVLLAYAPKFISVWMANKPGLSSESIQEIKQRNLM